MEIESDLRKCLNIVIKGKVNSLPCSQGERWGGVWVLIDFCNVFLNYVIATCSLIDLPQVDFCLLFSEGEWGERGEGRNQLVPLAGNSIQLGKIGAKCK